MEEKSKAERWFERWEKDRNQNKWKYYLVRGYIQWGLPVSIAIAISNFYFIPDYNMKAAVINLLGFIIVGILYGKWMWYSNEKRYQKYKDL